MTFAENVSSEVRVGLTGQLFRAPAGTPAPATATEVLDADFVGLGYFTEDGVTAAFDDSVEHIYPWQGNSPVRSVRTQVLHTIQFTPIQTRGNVLEAYHPGSVMTEPSPGQFRMEIKPLVPDRVTWVFDVLDGDIHMRFYYGAGEITQRGEIMFVKGEPIGYPMTMTAYLDNDGNTSVWMSDDAAWGEGLLGSLS